MLTWAWADRRWWWAGVTVPYRPMLGCIGVAPPRSALWETGINSMPGRGDMPAVRSNAPMLLLQPCSS